MFSHPAGLLTILLILSTSAVPALVAQSPAILEGTVADSRTGAPIQGAVVSLTGAGSALTDDLGAYRIEGLRLGRYTLTVQAIGYSSDERYVTIGGTTTVDIRLQEDAILLDPVEARLRRISILGTVVDTILDIALVDAEVTTSLGHDLRSNSRGQFRLRDVYEEYPLRLQIRLFGYLPFADIVTPGTSAEYSFALSEDLLVTGWISEQSARLSERASPRFVVGLPNLDRQEMLKYAGSHTLFDVLVFEHGERRLNRVRCILIDEGRPVVAGAEAMAILRGMLPEELQRVEFMFDGAMMRIYTRDFMRDMVARTTPLRQPTFVQPPRGPPLCR